MTERGQTLAYIRVSTAEQNLARQEYLREEADRVFEDKYSGKSTDRPGLRDLLAYARAGDRVVVHELARLGRRAIDVQELVNSFLEKGVSISFRSERLDFEPGKDNPMETFQLQVLAAFAEMERTHSRIRQAEGIAEAKARGVYKGARPSISSEQAEELRARVAAGVSVARVARELGVSRGTVYRYLDPATPTLTATGAVSA